MVWLLWRGCRSMGDAARFDDRFKSRIWRIVVASGVMGAVLIGLVGLVGSAFGGAGARYLALAVVVVIGMASYFFVGQLIGAFRLSDFKAAVRRG